MAGEVVERTTSVTDPGSVQEQTINVQGPTYSTMVANATSLTDSENRSYLSDPDNLIRHYFFDAPPQKRVHLRTIIASLIKDYNSILEVLKLSRQQNIKDAYDAGVDLLAELDNLKLQHQVYNYLETSETLLKRAQCRKGSQQRITIRLEDFWEILIKGISCAYKVSAEERLELIGKISLISQRRIVKTAVIDALVTIAEDMEDAQPVRNFLGRYTSAYESDAYVCDYAQDALGELE